MFRTNLIRLFQIVLLSGMLLSNIEIACAKSNGSGQVQLVEGIAIIVRQGKEIRINLYPSDFKDQDLIQTFDKGKVNLALHGGDLIYLAPNTKITYEEKLEDRPNFRAFTNLPGLPSLDQEDLVLFQAGSFQSLSVFQIPGRLVTI